MSELTNGGEPERKGGPAYAVVAAELRGRIVRGDLPLNGRLPTEAELADEFGVSRATIRESLRALAAQELIRTAKGANGGSFVTAPRVSHVSELLGSSITLLTHAHRVSLEQLLEAREVLEVPAAEFAAQRRRPDDLERLRQNVAEYEAGAHPLSRHHDFHQIVLEASGNTLLSMVAEPVFGNIVTNFDRSMLGARVHRSILNHHVEIADAIERGDSAAAGRLMRAHLIFLRPHYERLWRQAGRHMG
jgi:DNA-binding FadR family transcriptional regulator